jgi:hypothetical protein
VPVSASQRVDVDDWSFNFGRERTRSHNLLRDVKTERENSRMVYSVNIGNRHCALYARSHA